jgi:hypothetical protein
MSKTQSLAASSYTNMISAMAITMEYDMLDDDDDNDELFRGFICRW